MNPIDYPKQIHELMKVEADAKESIARLKERQKQQDCKQHDIATNIKLSAGGKYAELYTEQYHFYYGCKHTWCPKHGLIHQGHCECLESEFTFTVHDTDGKLLFCRPQRMLAPQTQVTIPAMQPFAYPQPAAVLHLLHGIGQYWNYIGGEYVLKVHKPSLVEGVIKKIFYNMRKYVRSQGVPKEEEFLIQMVDLQCADQIMADSEQAVMEALAHLNAVHEMEEDNGNSRPDA